MCAAYLRIVLVYSAAMQLSLPLSSSVGLRGPPCLGRKVAVLAPPQAQAGSAPKKPAPRKNAPVQPDPIAPDSLFNPETCAEKLPGDILGPVTLAKIGGLCCGACAKAREE